LGTSRFGFSSSFTRVVFAALGLALPKEAT
jgi:hypothetical protein